MIGKEFLYTKQELYEYISDVVYYLNTEIGVWDPDIRKTIDRNGYEAYTVTFLKGRYKLYFRKDRWTCEHPINTGYDFKDPILSHLKVF